MANVLLLLFGIIVYQGCSKAAPSENSHPVITTDVEKDVTLNREPLLGILQENDNDGSQSQRQKRFYDLNLGFDYPAPFDFPILPYSTQPHHSKREESRNTAVYGSEDTLNLIFRRLQEVVKDVRYQNRPTHHTPYSPAYIPLIYIPQFNCGCNNQGPAPPVNEHKPPVPPTSSETPPNEVTTSGNSNVTLGNRGGFDDKRQNWGIVTSKPDLSNSVNQGDGSRPINFAPIPPEEPMDAIAPPVDHGTVQAGIESGQPRKQESSPPQLLTTPAPINRPRKPEPPLDLPSSSSENFTPSLCDGAIITCCNRPQITAKCFESLGCQDPAVYGDPCDPKVQLLVINKFRYFQKRRAG